MREMRRAWLACVLIAAPVIATAAPPTMKATRIVGPSPRLDGKLDDPAWKLARVSDGFTQKFPDEAQAPSERTEVRVLYDDTSIYVGIDCFQQHHPIVARLTRRDRDIEADHITVGLDTRRSGTGAFEFAVNAAGVLQDTVRFDDTDSSTDWDENWTAQVARTDHGWSVEMRLPLRVLRFDRLPTQSWGMQVRRYLSARHETDEWSFIHRSEAGEVSRYGTLTDLDDLQPGRRIELRPFLLGRVRHRDAVADYLASGWDATGSAGLDLKWHLTQNLTLDAAINPDFAQVEADQIVLNLTTFETYYPEKRPFFLEGIDTFATPLQLLYTRRIGHVPYPPSLGVGESLVDLPDPTRIWGAAKMIGTLGTRLTVGTLVALTARNDVTAQREGGSQVSRPVDPLALWSVLRLKLQVGDNAHVGLMATGVSRFEPLAEYPSQWTLGATGTPTADRVVRPPGPTPTISLCPSGIATAWGARCFHDAYVAGIDGRWRSGDYVAQGQVIASQIVDGPPRILADGTIVKAGDHDWGAFAMFAKQGGAHWLWELDFDGSGRRLDYDDAGYMQRQNLLHFASTLTWRNLAPWWKTVETYANLELYDRFNLDGLLIARGYQINTQWKWNNFWETFVELHYRADHFDDREFGDGTAIERGGLLGLEIGVTSDPRRRVTGEIWTQTQLIRWPGDGLYFEADGRLTVRALPQLDFEILPTVVYAAGEPRYTFVAASSGAPLIGKLEASSVAATLRATYTFTPRLTLQAYAQLFLVARHYGAYYTPRVPSGIGNVVRLDALDPCPMPSINPDSEEGILNVSVVLRWEYLLGSVLYVVYTRAQSPNVILMTGQQAMLDIGAIHRAPAADAFMIKLSYWWG